MRASGWMLALVALCAACSGKDAGALDAGRGDAGIFDAGVADAGSTDAGEDAGVIDGGLDGGTADGGALPTPQGLCTGRDSTGGVPVDTFPGAACTGVPEGVALTRVPEDATSGAGWHVDPDLGIFYADTDDAVIDALDIHMCVKIFANRVTIQRSKIHCASYYVVFTADPPTQYEGLNLIDDELDGMGVASAQSIAVSDTPNAHFLRLNVHGMASSGPRVASGEVIEDSYFHDFACQSPDHSAGMSANGGGSGMVIRHNNIDIHTECATAAWEIAKDFGTYDDVLTERNLFNGGSYCAYAGIDVPDNSYGQATRIRFIGNVFGREYHPECGLNGPIAEWGTAGDSVWSGNVWGDGVAATSAHQTGDPVVP